MSYGVGDPGFEFWQGKVILPFLKKLKKNLGPTNPPTQWPHWPLYLELSGGGVRLTTHLRVVPRIRVSGAIPPFLLYAFMKCTNNLTFFSFPPIIN
jgi:hypothetical protein